MRRISEQIVGDGQGGDQAHLIFRGETEDAAVAAGGQHLGGGLGRFQTEEQTHPGHPFDPFRALEGGAEEVALPPDVCEQVVVDAAKDREGGGAADGVPAEGRAVIAEAEYVLDLLAEQGRAERKSARQPLRRRDDVGFDPVVHIGVEFAGPSVPGLHLVHGEQRVVSFAPRGKRLDEGGIERKHAALALDALDHHGGDRGFSVQGVEFLEPGVARIDRSEARRQRIVEFVIVILPRRGKGGQRSAVKTVLHRNDGVAVRAVLVGGVLARGFDRALVRLGARVREKDLFHPGLLHEQFGEIRAGGGVKKIGRMLDASDLIDHGFLPFLVRNPERRHPDPRGQVDVFAPVLGGEEYPFARRDRDGEAVVGTCDIGFVFFKKVHVSPRSISPSYRRPRRLKVRAGSNGESCRP